QHWYAFGLAISEHLRGVQPALGWTGRPSPTWEIPRLVDLLWVQLWNLETGGAAIRQCRHCRKWFAVDHLGKIYCSRECTNRASDKVWYAGNKARANRARTQRGRRSRL